MLKVMLQKLWHKIWMGLCLLLGAVLLIATVVSFPLYQNAVYDRMIRDEFDNYLADTGEWPFRFQMKTQILNTSSVPTIEKIVANMDTMERELGLPAREKVSFYFVARSKTNSVMERADLINVFLKLSSMSGLPEHAKLLSGSMYSEDGLSEDGAYEAVISQACMIKNNLLVGETLELEFVQEKDGSKARVKIVGVYDKKDRADCYWQESPEELDENVFIHPDRFWEGFMTQDARNHIIDCRFYEWLEYDGITARNIGQVLERTIYYQKEGMVRKILSEPVQRALMETCLAKQSRISATLFILQAPVLILIGAFLFMISGQMYDMEKNEISVMKSRGASSGQMFRLYLYQSVFLTGLGAAGGIPLGTVFCRILGSAGNFLEFNLRRNLEIKFERNVWIYAAVAGVGCILIMAIPALKHSRLSIVHLKQKSAVRRRAWWEIIFLDVILLSISLYGYRTFTETSEDLAASVVEGSSLNPLLYLSSSLFILGMGLLFLRLWALVIRLIFLCGRRFWSPAGYVSFTETIKNGKKQQFIMLFMILTISLGMYHAVVARTILQNAQENEEYMEETDVVIKEVWPRVQKPDGSYVWVEPDYGRFANMPDAATYSKVYTDDAFVLTLPDKKTESCTVVGIETKKYGLITRLYKGLLGKNYREYLNELAKKPNGVLLSANLRDVGGIRQGDKILFQSRFGASFTAEVVDFFEYWPGYQPTGLELSEQGEAIKVYHSRAIANLPMIQEAYVNPRPYEVWVKLTPDGDARHIYQWTADNGIKLWKFRNKDKQMKAVALDPLLQGTNGVLTMGFIVTIILCGVGYLIYWIMSIRSRELMFGILRACGMHRGELFHMLIQEQVFSGVLAIFAGIGIGHLASRMFTPLIQTAYAAADQVLPMKLIVNQNDLIRLYTVTAGAMALCLIVLLMLVLRLNITKALKLGEE